VEDFCRTARNGWNSFSAELSRSSAHEYALQASCCFDEEVSFVRSCLAVSGIAH